MRNVEEFRAWFETHVRLGDKPYTLDLDQACAVFDSHKNTLVTARAGSGKTRVIVAKVAYLVASHQAQLDEIAAFMFNRTAAAEVNERIGAVEIDGVPLRRWGGREREIRIASTFHKFALDLVKATGEQPELISELDRHRIIRRAVTKLLASRRIPAPEREEILRLVSSFIARAGQQFSGEQGLADLRRAVSAYCSKPSSESPPQSYRTGYNLDPSHTECISEQQRTERIFIHQIALAAYEQYLASLDYPKIDFNLLMSRAADLLRATPESYLDPTRFQRKLRQISRFKYLLVDEYQDFSYLFFDLIRTIRLNCPAAHLFAVGDDWQAINRFAGSDVDYFINFAKFFPEDTANVPLMTNYRSDRRIVENANRYMLRNYDPGASRAVPFSRKNGHIRRRNPEKTCFDAKDILEDGLGDARFQVALAREAQTITEAKGTRASTGAESVTSASRGAAAPDPRRFQKSAQLLKTVYKILKKHHREQILLLHRHNFTSFANVSLETFYCALRRVAIDDHIMTDAEFDVRVRCMTMHKSKGLESDVVVLLEMNHDQVRAQHPHATIFELFGDTRAAETADQHRLLYVALTRAKHKLYILSSDKKPVA